MTDDRKSQLIQTLKSVLAELAGKDLSAVDPHATFFELGFDSLLLTQVATLLKKRFRVKITFRQLLEELTTLEALAVYVDARMPNEVAHPPPPPATATTATVTPAVDLISAHARATEFFDTDGETSGQSVLERVMKEQLALMARQLEMLNGKPTHVPSLPAPGPSPAAPAKLKVVPQAFGPYRPINTKDAGEFTAPQQQALTALISRYTHKTQESKRQTQHYRAQFSDPRSVAGFRTFWKEMVYPIVTERSAGARFWDVDGNEYIDVTMGFGTNLLGHNPPFITEAIAEQLKKGIEVGPQSPLAGKVARLLCELSGHERAAFCNTGSEAVMAAIRVARTVTGRTRIATTGGFHGICDEVLVRANVVNGKRTTVPVAPGIPDHVAREVLVVDYGTKEGLEILKANMADLAMVLVEPVQSRHPDLQPQEFLRELRRITAAHETVLFFDEVITGFRCHLGGAQAHFGVQADMASWGKVMGGGMPIGALTGAAKYMDALDGGAWNYGDDSFPEAGVTFFAGTYVRHPLAMAAAHAILKHLKEQGPKLQEALTARTEEFVEELRAFLKACAVPLHVEQFASMFYLHFGPEIKHGSLLWFYLRDKGIHFWEGRPGFLSTAHTDEDIRYLLHAIKESVVEMQAAGFLPEAPAQAKAVNGHFEFPPLRDTALTVPTANGFELSDPTPEKRNVFHAPDFHASSDNEGAAAGQQIDFSVYFFGNYPAEYHADKYRLVIEAAKFADVNGFKAIWLPERHFHTVGGFSPNPSVIAAALARETRQLHLRAGSVVLPLHHPVRVAEEWAVVDNLSNGRAGISIASGWHPNDFVFAPDAFDRRRELCWEGCDLIQKLWQGEAVEFPTGGKSRLNVKLHPMPKQARLPVWLTCIHEESFLKAGELGTGVLCYTTNTTLDELAKNIRLYREAFAKHGHDPERANVTILMHTFVGPDRAEAEQTARQPLRNYIRTYLDNSQKRLENQHDQVEVDAADIEYLLDRGFDEYLNGKALIGSPESCAAVASQMKEIGVDEIGCFLDFGIDPEVVLAQLPYIAELKRLCHGQNQARNGSENNQAQAPKNPRPDRTIELPEAQKGLVAISTFGPDASRAYTEANTLELRGELNVAALRRALQRCVDRHEALRTSLNADRETQTIHAHVPLEVAFEDLAALPEDSQLDRQKELFDAIEARPFDLHCAPVMRAQIIKLAEDRHRLVLLFHHTLGNGPAYWLLLEDLCASYESEATGAAFTRPEPMQLSQFVAWRAEYATTAEYQAAEKFWLQQFTGGVPELNLPTDRPRPPLKTYQGGRCSQRLEPALTLALRQAGAAQRCSLYMYLLAGFKVLMHRLSGQDDLVIGTPFDSEVRSLPGGDGLFANTTNMTPLRSRVQAGTTFAEFLSATRRQVLECREHQDFFFGNLLRKLKIKSPSNRLGLISVGFNYETGTFKKLVAGVEVEFLTDAVPYRCPKDTSIFNLNLNVAEKNGGLLCECDYDLDLFDAASIQRMLNQFKLLLEAAAVQPEQLVSSMPIMGEAERRQLLVEWNATDVDYPRDRCVHELFAEQAARNPEAVALEWAGGRLTYRELNERANQLARHLRQLEVKPETLVAVYVERSVEYVVCVLGVLKAGGAYLPLDPDYPAERLRFMLKDSGAAVIITGQALPKDLALPGIAVLDLATDTPLIQACARTNPDQASRAGQLAYVIYTSGSSGQPKGVQIEHRGIVRLVRGQNYAAFDDQQRFLLLAATSFDASTFELWGPLLNGAVCVVFPQQHLNFEELENIIRQQRVTCLWLTAGLFNQIVDFRPSVLTTVQHVLTGGEALSVPHVQKAMQLLPQLRLTNGYGPTESTTFACCYRVEQGMAFANGSVPIGRPIGNTEVYILDGGQALVPVGVVGELYLGGAGLARGYLNRAELTLEKFILNPFKPEARLYKTGDLARWLPDGNLEYVGRVDQQVKVRGFRIELGEVEAVLGLHPAVTAAVVAAEGQQLVAYVVVRDGTAPTVAGLREFLLQKLPEPMVPGVYVTLPTLPLTPNGKVDRRALPALAVNRLGSGVAYAAPATAVEQALAGIWGELLGVAPVGVQDNFFALGGHSLLAVRLVNQVKAKLHLDLPMRTLFQHPTIQEIAQVLSVPKNVGRKPELIQLQAGNQAGPELFFLIDEGSLGLFKLAHFMGAGRSLFASVVPLPEAALKASAKRQLAALPKMEDLAAEHVALIKSRPTKAPVLLAGHCFGGMLALEVTRQLAAAGIPVAGVLLLDTWFARPTFWWQKQAWLSEHLGKLRQQGPRYLWRKSRRRIGLEKEALSSRLELSRSGDFSAQVPWAIIARIYRQAMAGYQPKPWPGRGLLLVSQDDWESNAYRQHDDTLGARHIFQGGVTVVNVPGDHVSVLEEPNLPELAARLKVGLEKFLVKNSSRQTSAKLETLADLNYAKQSPRQLSDHQSSFSCS